MHLTTDDLAAIKKIVNTAVEDSKVQTAAGFAEVDEKFVQVHEKIDNVRTELKADIADVDEHLSRVERIVTAEVQRSDQHSTSIQKIRKSLRAV